MGKKDWWTGATATLGAVMVMILIIPMTFRQTEGMMWAFMTGQWGNDLGPLMFWIIYAIAFVLMGLLARGSFHTSLGMAALYLADKFI